MSIRFGRAWIKIAHVITGPNVGGVERMLLKLLSAMSRSRLLRAVISVGTSALRDVGPWLSPRMRS